MAAFVCDFALGFKIESLLPPPAFGERGHRGHARRLVAVPRRAILMMHKGARTHSSFRHVGCCSHDAADYGAIGEL